MLITPCSTIPRLERLTALHYMSVEIRAIRVRTIAGTHANGTSETERSLGELKFAVNQALRAVARAVEEYRRSGASCGAERQNLGEHVLRFRHCG